MSESVNDGGPAFPTQNGCRSDEGMSMRDWLASQEQSLPPLSWIQCHLGSGIESIDELKGVELSRMLSRWRYQMADAMIEAREEGQL